MNPVERRATTMRMIATELESGSERSRRLTSDTFGVRHWLRMWADELDPHDEEEER